MHDRGDAALCEFRFDAACQQAPRFFPLSQNRVQVAES
jgi:hypothetical protein